MKTSSRLSGSQFMGGIITIGRRAASPSMALLLLFSLLIGCAPRLDLNPALDIPDDMAVKNTDDLNQVLTSAYASLGSKYFLGGSIKIWPDVISDQVIINPASPYSLKETNIANRQFNSSDSLIILAWEQGYRAVNLANQVIDKVDNGGLTGAEFEQNKNRMQGEAYFIRAVALFELSRFFAPTYSANTASLPSIPMPLSPAISRQGAATPSLDQLYQQIKTDLIRSATLLPFRYANTTAKSGSFSIFGNATGAAAKTYLARVCFQQGGSGNELQALQAINETIGLVDTLREGVFYPQNFQMIGSNTRDIGLGAAYQNYGVLGRGAFSAGSSTTDLTPEVIFNIMNRGDQDFSRELFYRYTYDVRLPGTNPRYLLADSFVRENFTLRSDARFAYYPGRLFYNGNRFCIQKWFNATPTFNVIVVRSAELVLTRARIHFNLAKQTSDTTLRSEYLTKALYDMFYVKKKSRRLTLGTARPLDNLNLSYARAKQGNNTAFENALDIELNRERQRELFGEGDRLHDIRRQGLLIIPGNRAIGSENIPDLNLPLEQSILPIPISETAINASLNR